MLPVPPLLVAVIEPVELPKQSTFVCPLIIALNPEAGWVIVTVATEEQPFASVPVTE